MSSSSAGPTFNFSNASVAMIDASPLSLEVMTSILSGYGFRKMYRCGDLVSGTDVLKTHSVDLVLLDPYGFEEEAFRLIRWFRSDRRGANVDVPVIITTAHTRIRMITSTRECGADYVIAKPFSTNVLLDRILWVATREGRRGELTTHTDVVNQSGSGLELW
ncbi:PleD family two-component system response regulator [Terricaulis sp.]|uniref:PleD family two-component system response regulator n=1 Tax=Terricaulis sp. TaxID=2768686 RepID=UPI0037835E39